MSKSICVKCIYVNRHSGHYYQFINCEHPSNIHICTNYVTGKKTILYRDICSKRNTFGNCRDFVEHLTLWQELKNYLTKLFSCVRVREKGENE